MFFIFFLAIVVYIIMSSKENREYGRQQREYIDRNGKEPEPMLERELAQRYAIILERRYWEIFAEKFGEDAVKTKKERARKKLRMNF